MKLYIVSAAAMLMACTTAYAGGKADANSYAGSQSLAAVNVISHGANKVKTTGAAVAPGLIASGLSCSGSTSIGGGWMGGAISLGMTTKDRDCDTRENAKIMGLMGEMNVAYEVMCGINEVRIADAAVGRNRCVKNNVQRTVRTNGVNFASTASMVAPIRSAGHKRAAELQRYR